MNVRERLSYRDVEGLTYRYDLLEERIECMSGEGILSLRGGLLSLSVPRMIRGKTSGVPSLTCRLEQP